MQHLVTAELRDVHVARMRFYAGDQLEISGELLKVFDQLRTRASTTFGASRPSSGHASGDEFVVKVAWEGLEEAESTLEPVSHVFHDAPAVQRKELKALRLKAEQKRALVQWYGLRL